MASTAPSLDSLLCLSDAGSKAAVLDFFNDAFECRHQGLTRARRLRLQADLGLVDAQETVTKV